MQLGRFLPSVIRLSVGIATLMVACSPSTAAHAASTCATDAPRVEVSIDGGEPKLAASVRAELVSELRRGKLCTDADGAPPLARIVISFGADDRATVRISDEVTHKTVEREVSVAGLPADGRALPIAIAADELLRASWAEITLHTTAEGPPPDVPKVVRDSVGQPPRPDPYSRHNEIGIDFSTAAYGGGQTELGGGLFYRRDLVSWLAMRLSAFGREGVPVAATDGSIRAHAFGGALSLAAFPLRAGKLRVGPSVGVEVGYLVFEGIAHQGAKSSSYGSATVFGDLGATASLELLPLCLSLSALARAPFRAATAMDGKTVASGASGAGFVGSFGAGVPF